MHDIPTFGWLLAGVITARITALGGVILAGASIIDHGADPTRVAVAVVVLALGVVMAALEQILPDRLRAAQERRWRINLAAANLELDRDDDADLIQAATEAAEKSSVYTVTFLGPLVAAAVAPLCVLLLIGLGLSWPVADLLLLTTLMVPLLVAWAVRGLKGAGAAYGRSSGMLAGAFLAGVRSLRSALILNATAQRRAQIAGLAEHMRSKVMGLLYRNQVMILVTDGAFGLATMTVAAASGLFLLRSGAFSPAQALACVLLARLVIVPVNDMGRTFYTGASGKASLRKIRALLGSAPQPEIADVPQLAAAPSVTVGDLCVVRGDRTVLGVSDLHVPAGSHLAVVGPSGSGKSTLLLALGGLLSVEGEVLVGGRAVSREELAAVCCYVPQRPVLFTGTLAENLDLSGHGYPPARLREVAEAVGLDFDLDQPISERRALSGGETVRVAIARGLLQGAGVLLLDEPTANLDWDTAAAVRATAKSTGATIIEVTHRVSETADADAVVAVVDGELTDPAAFLDAARSSEEAH
ncbi:ABC transporter ATP-binding protein [Corynebacterium frankenforstense]|uniref:ATP-binding cassette domain-containing protein n=1 Tax=Corynebacterium frankenforstense TaxID=1230998 RepID=UPI0026EA3876|nr:ABC transporter ATP-binding protein [Corynebacterium frankenforstense]